MTYPILPNEAQHEGSTPARPTVNQYTTSWRVPSLYWTEQVHSDYHVTDEMRRLICNQVSSPKCRPAVWSLPPLPSYACFYWRACGKPTVMGVTQSPPQHHVASWRNDSTTFSCWESAEQGPPADSRLPSSHACGCIDVSPLRYKVKSRVKREGQHFNLLLALYSSF